MATRKKGVPLPYRPTIHYKALELNATFAIRLVRPVDSRGIRYKYLWWNSGELGVMISTTGCSEVRVRLNPANLASVLVLHATAPNARTQAGRNSAGHRNHPHLQSYFGRLGGVHRMRRQVAAVDPQQGSKIPELQVDHLLRQLAAALDRAVARRGQFSLIEVMLPRGVTSDTLARFVSGFKAARERIAKS